MNEFICPRTEIAVNEPLNGETLNLQVISILATRGQTQLFIVLENLKDNFKQN